MELILRILNDFLEYIVINRSTNALAGKCNFVNKGYIPKTLSNNYTLVHVNQKIIKIQIYNEPAMLLEEKALGKKLNKLALISMVMLGP